MKEMKILDLGLGILPPTFFWFRFTTIEKIFLSMFLSTTVPTRSSKESRLHVSVLLLCT